MGIHTNSKGEKFMVFEFVDGGNLVDYLVANRTKLEVQDLLQM